MKAIRWVGLAVAVVGALDLLFGNTNKPLLPAAVGNALNQQTDLLLVLGGGSAFVFVK